MKRYVATIEIYVYSKSDLSGCVEADEICKELRNKYDNHAAVVDFVEQPFGKIESRKIDFKKIRKADA